MFGPNPQPTPFDLHWRMFGIDVCVHPFFWLMSALLGWGWSEVGLGYLLLWVLCVFVSVLIHELGHVVMGRVFGSYGHILLYSFGGLAFGSNDLRRRWQRIVVLFAGPGAQFILYGLLWIFAFFLVPVAAIGPHERGVIILVVALKMLLAINLFWPLLNLLPIYPLDGGQISREVGEGWLGQRGVIASVGISFGLSALLALEMLLREYNRGIIPLFPGFGGGMYMVIFFALLAVTSYQMLQMELSRRRWRDNERLPWE